MWEKEEILSEHDVYVRVALSFISSKDNNPSASAFSNTPKDGSNLSSDWSRYSTAKESWENIGRQKKTTGEFKDPNKFRIWGLNVGKVRQITPTQVVEHDPVFEVPENEYVPNNRAHSIIIGDKPIKNNVEFRVSLVKSGKWEII
ncbi:MULTISPECIES: hypothetical protein [Sphingobacterium]|uniref:hypothetical protein n=1 Tax=Sphingobacterium TaxID=28453 RepID=UPI0025803721|nr:MULTISPECIES: hypothetical protein [Sphingobacterium]